MTTIADLVRRLREPCAGRITTMGDAVLQVTIGLPPAEEAADRLTEIERAWRENQNDMPNLVSALRRAIEGTNP